MHRVSPQPPYCSFFFFPFTLGFHNIFHLYRNSLLESLLSSIWLSSNLFFTLQPIYSFPYLKPISQGLPNCPQEKIQPLSVAFRAFHQLALTYLSRLIYHHFLPHTCFNKTELVTVPKYTQLCAFTQAVTSLLPHQ